MSKASGAANALVYAAVQVCGLYGVQVTREQSRMFNVQGASGRWRPMFFGEWTDNFGKIHRKGKSDLLARPRILAQGPICNKRLSVPLWIECKTGKGRMEIDQIEFKNWVESNGDNFILLHDDVRPLISWMDAHGVEKDCTEAALRNVAEPMDASLLTSLPCRWCKKSRADHIGIALGCPGRQGLLGKVWSPDLKAERS